jgi:hypothetical protein
MDFPQLASSTLSLWFSLDRLSPKTQTNATQRDVFSSFFFFVFGWSGSSCISLPLDRFPSVVDTDLGNWFYNALVFSIHLTSPHLT